MKKYILLIFTLLILHNLIGCSSNKDNELKNENNTNSKQGISTNNSSLCPTQLNPISSPDLIKLQNIDEIYNNLTEICKRPRPIESKAILTVKDYISTKMEAYGYDIKYQDFQFTKLDIHTRLNAPTAKDYLSIQFDKDTNKSSGTNIIASKQLNNQYKTLYICAHYDTTDDTSGEIDNGSGVVTILDIARKIKYYALPINIVFIFFSAEETGMSGSCFFVSNLSDLDKKQALGCINIDCICQKYSDSEIYKNINGMSENALSLSIDSFHRFKSDDSSNSDHRPFYYGEIPSVSFTDWPYDVKDDTNHPMNNIDPDKVNQFSNLLVNYLCNFNLSEYTKYIDTNYKVDYSIKSNEIYILDYKLQELSHELIANGSRSKLVCLFKNNNDKSIVLTVDNKRFISSTELDKISKGKEYKGYHYYINEKSDGIEIHYSESSSTRHYAILSGNISENEALKLIAHSESVLQTLTFNK